MDRGWKFWRPQIKQLTVILTLWEEQMYSYDVMATFKPKPADVSRKSETQILVFAQKQVL